MKQTELQSLGHQLAEVVLSPGLAFAEMRGDAAALAAADVAGEHLRNALTILRDIDAEQRLRKTPLALSSIEREESFAEALISMARAGHVARTIEEQFRPDLVRHCRPEHVGYWDREYSSAVGLLMNSETLKERLAKEGVVAWYSVTPRLVRCVDLQWLDRQGDEAIVKWVAEGRTNGGWYCRACAMPEGNGGELIEVYRRSRGEDGREFNAVDRIHEQCFSLWHSTVARTAFLTKQRISLSRERP